MSRLARVFLRASCADEEYRSIVIDLVLRSDRTPLTKICTSGWEGNLNGGNFYPFTIRANGELDYGSEYEVGSRYATTNLWAKSIREGEYVTFVYEGNETCYVVQKMTWFDELVS